MRKLTIERSTITAVIIVFCLISIFQLSCKGTDGPTGPQGPPGTANVKYSQWFSPSAWSGTTEDWFFDTTATAITQSIIDSGVVLAYMKLPDDSLSARPLPAYPTSQSVYVYSYAIPSAGKIRFTIVTNDDGFVPSTAIRYRYVIIPGGKELNKLSPISYHNYEQVKDLYNIQD